ncbi:purine-nucleoside phosphorylase [Spiroplasma turonicum]|uniref:Uridine phosphorylase n=1 Tax=Spiroplasma turonicum TaxID=216946 RepID=A0A0K1P645_9MOLU|nr:purine-nucleoside phosphorylase [Spiroplasma turonicum]AKU79649.1 purine nucleoside phosphorylase [Spiroplasma turonicum]ALX70669.1 purine-nucleoside phosphorylase [Spiroplasma turonicum]
MPTPHNNAEKNQIAKNVLMPGDPERCKWIVDNYLTNVEKVSSVRGIDVYTGLYKNKKISVTASGMGMPSMLIYAWELFGYYNVDSIIRIGTAGSYLDNTKINDIVISMAASTDSNIQTHFNIPADWHYSPTADFKLLNKAFEVSKALSLNLHIGPTVCTDGLYTLKNVEPEYYKEKTWSNLNILCSDMETYSLYACSNYFKKKALSILTVVVNKENREGLSSKDRENNVNTMVELALETLIANN